MPLDPLLCRALFLVTAVCWLSAPPLLSCVHSAEELLGVVRFEAAVPVRRALSTPHGHSDGGVPVTVQVRRLQHRHITAAAAAAGSTAATAADSDAALIPTDPTTLITSTLLLLLLPLLLLLACQRCVDGCEQLCAVQSAPGIAQLVGAHEEEGSGRRQHNGRPRTDCGAATRTRHTHTQRSPETVSQSVRQAVRQAGRQLASRCHCRVVWLRGGSPVLSVSVSTGEGDSNHATNCAHIAHSGTQTSSTHNAQQRVVDNTEAASSEQQLGSSIGGKALFGQ